MIKCKIIRHFIIIYFREDSDVLELQCSVQKKVTKTHAEKKTAKAKANNMYGLIL